MNKIVIFTLAVVLINIACFFTLSADVFALSFTDFQVYQLLSFQFMHFSLLHLVENIIGLAFVAGIAVELDMKFESFLMVYLLAVFIAVPVLSFFPGAVIAGNSTGIYGVLAATLSKARNFISQKITLPLFTVFIFSLSIANFFMGGVALNNVLKTDIFHFSGFASGTVARLQRRRVKRILRG
ncbi:MAG: rhomboid family intramembrane serine protease [Candidatus Aenigmatarchaeota archaeon]